MNQLGDIGARLLAKYASASTSVTAGGSGDAALITGASIDLTTLASRPNSVSFMAAVTATLTEAATLTVTGSIEVSADGTNFYALVATKTILTLTGGTGGSTETGVAKIDAYDLARNVPTVGTPIRYVRVKLTPDASATKTDTAVVGAAVGVFGLLNNV